MDTDKYTIDKVRLVMDIPVAVAVKDDGCPITPAKHMINVSHDQYTNNIIISIQDDDYILGPAENVSVLNIVAEEIPTKWERQR